MAPLIRLPRPIPAPVQAPVARPPPNLLPQQSPAHMATMVRPAHHVNRCFFIADKSKPAKRTTRLLHDGRSTFRQAAGENYGHASIVPNKAWLGKEKWKGEALECLEDIACDTT
eukprot:4165856-Amphidinium_carterae.1